MKTAVIYSRVSTQEQSFQSQIDDLQKYAEYANLQIVGIFSEKVSGYIKDAERTEFDNMQDFVLANSVELILCWELSRFGRNSIKTQEKIEFYRQKNIDIYFKKENIYTLSDNPMSKLVLNLLSSIAEFELQTIVSRSKRGKISAAELGKRSGFLIMPYGFKAVDGYIAIDEEEAKYVKMMYEMASQGLSLRAIAKKLNSLDIPTRKGKLGTKRIVFKGTEKETITEIAWRRNTLRKILTSTLYKGERNYKYTTDVIKIPQIVDEEIWNKTQTIFETHIGCINNTKYDYLFKGKMYCGKCGYIMGTRTERRYANLPSYYFCTARRETNIKCNCGQFDSKIFDEMIYTQLFKNTKLMESVFEDTSKKFDIDEKQSQIKHFEGELFALEAKKKRVNFQFKEGYTSATDMKQEHLVIRNSIIELENNIGKIAKEIQNFQGFDIADILIKLTDETNFEIKYEFVAKFVNKIKVYKVDNYDIDFSKLTYADFWKDGERKLKNPHGNDKLIYVEIFAFDNPKPLKVALTNVSKQCYINDSLEYTGGHLTIK